MPDNENVPRTNNFRFPGGRAEPENIQSQQQQPPPKEKMRLDGAKNLVITKGGMAPRSNKPFPREYQIGEDGYIPPRDRYIMSLKPEDIELGYFDIRICDLIPKGPNSPNKHHNAWGRRKSALNPLDDFENSCKMAGRMKFMLFSRDVPKTVANFKELLKNKEGAGYVRTNFHSIVGGFMMQGGDTEHQNGRGGVSIYGRNMPDENFIVQHTHKGMMGMANMGPNTNGSQFYITQRPTPWLDNEHVVFGKIVDGFELLRTIDEHCSSKSGLPPKFVQIAKCGMYKNKHKKEKVESVSIADAAKIAAAEAEMRNAAEEINSANKAKMEELRVETPTGAEPVVTRNQVQPSKSWWKIW